MKLPREEDPPVRMPSMEVLQTPEKAARAQSDAMGQLRGFVDALRDISDPETPRVDAAVQHAIAQWFTSPPVGADTDDRPALDRATHGLQKLMAQLALAMQRLDDLERDDAAPTRALGPSKAPKAPMGLLSLRDYAALQAVVEVFFCWAAFPCVAGGILLPIEKRRPTKTLAIIPEVLLWGSHQRHPDPGAVTANDRLLVVVSSMTQLLLLPQLRPILLPKYIVELMALLVYGETSSPPNSQAAKSFCEMCDSLLPILPLRLTMTSLRAALGQCSTAHQSTTTVVDVLTAFKSRCGQRLTQLLLCNGGVQTTIEMLLSAVDEGNTRARLQVATLICQCPADTPRDEYATALCRQVMTLFAPQNRVNRLLTEAAVVLVNEMVARFPIIVDTALFSVVLAPLLAYEANNDAHASSSNRDASEQDLDDCVGLMHLLLCGPPPSLPLLRALTPVVRPLVHMYAFAVASKSYLAPTLQGILQVFVKMCPRIALLLQLTVLPVIPPRRATLSRAGTDEHKTDADETSTGWYPVRQFAAGGSGGIALRCVSAEVVDEDAKEMVVRDLLQGVVAALVPLLAAKELEQSVVVGELFSSLLLSYMKVRRATVHGHSAPQHSDQQNDPESSSTLRDGNAADTNSDGDGADNVDDWAAYERVKEPVDALGAEMTLSLLIAIIDSLGASVLRSAETVLQCIITVLAMFVHPPTTSDQVVTSPLHADHGDRATDKDEDDDDEVLTVCLGVVLTILEAGSSSRSEREETVLRSMLPILADLALSSRRPEVAELASDARARILSRGADALGDKPSTSMSHAVSFERVLEEARSDLSSALVPLRARGVVTLTKLVRQTRLEPSTDQWRSRISALLEIFMDQLSDTESYVFLAAVHGLAALADAHPKVAIPLLVSAFRDTTLSLEKRIKLSESLLFTAKRCGEILPQYAKTFVYAYLTCISPPSTSTSSSHSPSQRSTSFSLIQEVHADTPMVSDEQRQRENHAREQAMATALAEATLRASCLSNLAEVCGMLRYALAPFAVDVMSCVVGILQLELDMQDKSVVAVRRGAVFLLQHVLDLLGAQALEVLSDQLKDMYHMLKHVERVEKDEVVRFHARNGLAALNDIMRSELFPSRERQDEDVLGINMRSLRILK